MASQLNCLTLLATVTRWFILQKARRHANNALRLLVSIRFQVLFHSPPGVLFTFPSRYWFTIGRQVVFSLGGWSPQIPTGFLVSRGTWDTLCLSAFSPTGVLPSVPGLSSPLRLKLIPRDESPATPAYKYTGLGFSAFARRYLRNHCCFLFLRVLRCFSSPGCLLYAYIFSIG